MLMRRCSQRKTRSASPSAQSGRSTAEASDSRTSAPFGFDPGCRTFVSRTRQDFQDASFQNDQVNDESINSDTYDPFSGPKPQPYSAELYALEAPYTPTDVNRLLAKQDPLLWYHLFVVVAKPTFFQNQSDLKARAMFQSTVIKDDLKPTPVNIPGEKYVSFLSQGQTSRNIPIVFDTGCSISVSGFREDFIGPIREANAQELSGISGNRASIAGIGTVR